MCSLRIRFARVQVFCPHELGDWNFVVESTVFDVSDEFLPVPVQIHADVHTQLHKPANDKKEGRKEGRKEERKSKRKENQQET